MLVVQVNAVFYLRITPETMSMIEAYENGMCGAGGGISDRLTRASDVIDVKANVPGSIRLLHRWCANAMNDDVLRGALKMIGTARNFTEVCLPPLLRAGSLCDV
jgi:hypothetical protein